jgi:thiosulfate/3-mercaptopyruvate sulfurtransferase
MDGGRMRWELDSRPQTDVQPARPPAVYHAQDADTSIRAFRDEVLAAIGQVNLIDVRSPDEFAGRLMAPAYLPQEQAQRAGHIPTAKNVPWSQAARPDGTFTSDDELRTLYREAGVDTDTDTIAHCRIGERSAHTWFVLHELLDRSNVRSTTGRGRSTDRSSAFPSRREPDPAGRPSTSRLNCFVASNGDRFPMQLQNRHQDGRRTPQPRIPGTRVG